MAEAERLRAAGDAHKRELAQAKLAEREAELSAAQEKLRAAKREAASAPMHCAVLPVRLEAWLRGWAYGDPVCACMWGVVVTSWILDTVCAEIRR